MYLNINLQPHQYSSLKATILLAKFLITPEEAVLGTEIKVPTPDGSVSMKIPPGVDSGQSLRLKNKGWKAPNGKRSDQIVKLKIVTPKKLTKKERDYYDKLRQISSFNPHRNLEHVSL